MAHKTLIDGTGYTIIGGTTLIDGTSHRISAGSTLIDGTARLIPLVSSVGDFDWGSEEGEADEQWFADLQNYLLTNPAPKDWVGKTKYITLSEPVLATTTHKIWCIGVNQDAENSVTFQTVDCLDYPTTFYSTSLASNVQPRWDSANNNVSNILVSYRQASPMNGHLIRVTKGACNMVTIPYEDSRDSGAGTATFTPCWMWLLSEGELFGGKDGGSGWIIHDRRDSTTIHVTPHDASALTYDNWTYTNSECTNGKKFQYDLWQGQITAIREIVSNTQADTVYINPLFRKRCAKIRQYITETGNSVYYSGHNYDGDEDNGTSYVDYWLRSRSTYYKNVVRYPTENKAFCAVAYSGGHWESAKRYRSDMFHDVETATCGVAPCFCVGN